MKLILEAKDQLAVRKFASGRYRGFVELQCRERWQAHANWEVNPSAPPLYAEIDKGSWRVMCECREAFVIDYGEDYFCPNCLNLAHGGKARKVIFPSHNDRMRIEELLSRRPNPNNRNWLPHETVKDLERENEAHGINGVLE